jgi:NAD(P)H-dependent FMN reductase
MINPATELESHSMSRPVLVISGTNRPAANAMKVARVVLDHYRNLRIDADLLSLAELPAEVFDPGAYAAKPASMLRFQQRVLDALGLHVITPEYNGSFPGVLKYFIDMLKFPESFERKPVAFIGEANGVWGGLRAVEQLQLIFGYRNAYVYPLRVFISGVGQKFDADGRLIDPAIDQRIAMQVDGFAKFARLLGE